MRILLAEETEPLAEAIADILRMADYKVRIVANGEEGMKEIPVFDPQLVITDIEMPVMNGLDFLRNIRSSDEKKNVPVIILSAKVSSDDIRKGLEAGANVYLKKPCSADELLTAVDDVLKGYSVKEI